MSKKIQNKFHRIIAALERGFEHLVALAEDVDIQEYRYEYVNLILEICDHKANAMYYLHKINDEAWLDQYDKEMRDVFRRIMKMSKKIEDRRYQQLGIAPAG